MKKKNYSLVRERRLDRNKLGIVDQRPEFYINLSIPTKMPFTLVEIFPLCLGYIFLMYKLGDGSRNGKDLFIFEI